VADAKRKLKLAHRSRTGEPEDQHRSAMRDIVDEVSLVLKSEAATKR
jgi:hypothetical protein